MTQLKSPRKIELLRDTNRIVAEILAELKAQIEPGISTLELSELSDSLAATRNGRTALKGYNGFPHARRVSVNEEVVHGIPS